jgi:cyclophilin family peptidyl-prolyl cis-trans isomerase
VADFCDQLASASVRRDSGRLHTLSDAVFIAQATHPAGLTSLLRNISRQNLRRNSMAIRNRLLTILLGATLALTGCQQKGHDGGTNGATTGGTTGGATGAVATPDPATPSPAVTATPDLSATPDASATPSESGTPTASATPQTAATPGEEIAHTLKPLPGKEDMVPKITKKTTINFKTTAGEIVIEVYPEAAPNAAKRFVELVDSGYFDDTPVSRVVAGFVAQFGINWREPHKDFKDKTFNDDPTLFSLDPGTLAFAKAGPNTNSTQVFINFTENNRLADPTMNFTTFGKVVKGMEVVNSFAVVGDPSGGLDQQRMWDDGAAYIESLDEKPTMIEKATVVK